MAVFSNVFIRPLILSFLSCQEGDRAKTVSRAFKSDVEKVQRLKIIGKLSPKSIAAFGKENLDRALICNFPKYTYIHDGSFSIPGQRSKDEVCADELPASFVIGLTQEKHFYAALWMKTMITGRSCLSRFSLEVTKRCGYVFHSYEKGRLYQNNSREGDDETLVVASLRPILSGGEVEVRLWGPLENLPDEPEKPRCTQRVFFCLRRVFLRCGLGCGLLKVKQKLA